MRAEPHAVVDRAVAAAGDAVRPQAKGLVNALLRRFLRERDAVLAQVDVAAGRALVASALVDLARAKRLAERLGADPRRRQRAPAADVARQRARDDARGARRALRVGGHRLRGRRRERDRRHAAAAGARAAGLRRGRVLGAGRRRAARREILDARDGERVLDACAAPGGKATHVLERADVELVALDSDAARLARVVENATRLRLPPERLRAVAGDAAAPASWWDGRPFDRILADVPCTASGIVRRHPDGKWLRRPATSPRWPRRSARCSTRCGAASRPGGTLVYATCSVFVEENEVQAAAFAARTPGALRESVAYPPEADARGGQLLPSLPGARHNQDGFFYARFRKG
jgi:16S rRNA (cytosine967-C5)-methyltransferase